MSFTQLEVLCAASRSDMDYAGTFLGVDVLPRINFMNELLSLEFGKAGFVFFPHQLFALKRFADIYYIAFQMLQSALSDYQIGVIGFYLYADVFYFRIHRQGGVRGQRPRRGRPQYDLIVGAFYGKFRKYRKVLHFGIGAAHFMIGKAGSATRAPRHRTVRFFNPAALGANL